MLMMKNYFDKFYEVLHKNSIKRRRMVSLLLVLSMFVSSSVVWGLRGTVFTLVNEEEPADTQELDETETEKLAYHVHTDECYQDVLICELEEDEEHTHTDECYEKQLICGFDEEDTIPDELVPDEDAAEETEAEAAETPEAEEADTEEDAEKDEDEEEVVLDAQLPDMMLAAGPQALASEKPPTIQTVDNIAEGIKFTLFDYGGNELENQNNNYGFDGTWVKNEGDDKYHFELTKPYAHGNVVASGINTGRNINDDIMFFAYGTPVPSGIMPEEGQAFYNYTDGSGQHYHPDKNSYSGDYNANPVYSGNRAVKGIVNTTLGADGYPTIVGSNHHSLNYLFAPSTSVDGVDQSAYKTVYNGKNGEGVNHLLQKVTGPKGAEHLVFNSDQNYAYFDKDTNNFIVYGDDPSTEVIEQGTFEIINDNHHRKDDINNIKFDSNENPIKYDKDVDPGFKIGFFPFDEYDDTRRDPNYDGNGYNHHFGMTMEATFSNDPFDRINVTEPITFKYSGDDDMWVFVDGKLVLDLGGIHEPAGGMIDFSNGLVWSQDNGATSGGLPLTSDDPNADSVQKWMQDHGYLTNQSWDDIPKPIANNTSLASANKWIVEPITNYLPDWTNENIKNGTHDIKMFYLERGGCYSNLAMEMNLPTLKPLSVIKNVEYKEHLDKTYDNAKYWFQVYEWIDDTNEWIIPSDIGALFSIQNGERKKFDNLGQARKFKVVEVGYSLTEGATGPEYGIDNSVFDSVTVYDKNNQLLNSTAENGTVATDGALLKDVNSYTFNNSIQEDFRDVNIKKAWDCGEEKIPNDFTVKFKIMRTDSVTGEVKQVALKTEDPQTHKMVKRRTFTIKKNEWLNGVTIPHLLKQYGDHYYTYNVEELNTPNGFKAAYGYDSDGNITITNTDITKMQINIRKDWDNIDTDGRKVQLRLTREKVGYSASEPTSLKVRMMDEGGNLIKELDIPKSDNKIYAGGSAELAYVLPEGVQLYEGDTSFPSYSPSNLKVKFDDGILVLDNLAAETTADTPANVVEFKVTSNNAKDELWILHHSFTKGTNGWSSNGGANAASSVNGAYAKGDGLVITGRTHAWQGARLYLDPALFKANKTYTFTTYVKSEVADDFKFTFNNGLGSYTPLKKENAGYFSVPANTWTPITGVLKLPETIDPYNMFIIVESKPYNNGTIEDACRGNKFYMDEFVAIEGNNPVEVNQTTGEVVISGAPAVTSTEKYSIDFNDTKGNWTGRGDATNLSNGHDTNNHFDYMVVSNRKDNWHGAQLMVPFLEKGHTYHVESYVQGNGGSNINNVYLKLDAINSDSGGKNRYIPIGSGTVNDGDNTYKRSLISADFTVPDYANVNQMYIYFEGDESGSPYNDFRVHNITITEQTVTSTSVSGEVDGYKIENGKYVSDYSNYGISLDENSVTNPLHLDSDYALDPDFKKTVTLDSTTGWTYHWDNDTDTDSAHQIIEEANFLYKYYLEEVWVDSAGNTISEVNGDLITKDGNYLVTYRDNGVATNDPANPIVVNNKYIWYKLPATGGIGTDKIYLLSIMLIIIGITSGCCIYSRRRRLDENS